MIRKVPKRKLNKNNRGFSLIELLVAVTVLAIITIPLLHSFVTAAKTNAKSKRVLEAATAGQNLFEELKSADVDTFMSAAVKTALTNDDGTQKKDTDGNIIYTLTSEFDRTVNGHGFHMKVTLNPLDYTTEEGQSSKGTDYNSIVFSKLSNLSKANNAFLILSADDMNLAVDELLMMQPVSEDTETAPTEEEIRQQILEHLTRDIVIEVKHNESTGVSIVTATVTYSDGTNSYCSMNSLELYNNGMELENVLSNVFICYYPMYNNSSRLLPTEHVTIDNTGNYPIGVYLVKQTGADAAASEAQKQIYSIGLDVKEGVRALTERDEGGNEIPSASVTMLTTNLEYVAGNDTLNELQLKYSGNVLPPGLAMSDVLNLSAGSADGLKRKEASTCIYNVTIEVYDKKDGEGEVTYGAEDLLTTIEGTKME